MTAAPKPIVTLTLNPAVDVSSMAASVVPAHKLRCHDVRHDPGGGGINVSRVLKRLGGETLALFTAGGPMGVMLERLIEAEQVPFGKIPVAGDTREDFAVLDEAAGTQYRFVLPGPSMSPAECDACLAAVSAQAMRAFCVVASGSLPPGVPVDVYGEVARAARASEKGLVIDSSGPALAAALRGAPYLVKPSRRELEELAGRSLSDRAECAAAASGIVERGGAELVAVTLGAEGALLIGRHVALEAPAPAIVPRSTVGAGDSFLAALLWSLSRDAPPETALRMAVAAGAAALLAPGTALASFADVMHLAEGIPVRSL